MIVTQLAWLLVLCHVTIATSLVQSPRRLSLERSKKPRLSRAEFDSLLHRLPTAQTSPNAASDRSLDTQTPLSGTKRKHPSAPLTNYFDEAYLLDVHLGTPPQSFRVKADLASSEFWVLGKTAGLVFCHDHGCYDSSRSRTFKRNGSDYTWMEESLEEPFRGHVSIDSLTVAGLNATKQPFGEVNDGDRFDFALYFEFEPNDGIFGLGPAKYDTRNGVKSPIHSLLSQTSEAKFSLYLGGEEGSSDSEIVFGGADSKRFSGDLHEIPALRGHPSWAVGLDNLFAGNKNVALRKGAFVELASANSEIGLPGNLFAYFESIVIPEDPEEACNARSEMPDLDFELSGKNYTLTPHDYVEEIFEGYCASRFYATDSEMNDPPKFVFGLSILEKYYSVFDLEKHQISLALAK